jgi:hypothetical protein
MPSENLNMDEVTDARRKALAETIQTISVEEMKALGEGLFPTLDNPWREQFFDFIAMNPGATFHHADTHDGVQILYCRDKEKGIWFVPGSGMGPLQAKGLKIMKEIVEGAR